MSGATTLLIIDIGAHLVRVLNTAHLKLKSSFPTLSAGVVTETLHFTYDATNDTSAVYGDVVCVIHVIPTFIQYPTQNKYKYSSTLKDAWSANFYIS